MKKPEKFKTPSKRTSTNQNNLFGNSRNNVNPFFKKYSEQNPQREENTKQASETFFKAANSLSKKAETVNDIALKSGEDKATKGSITLGNNSFNDTATESHKKIKFNAKVPTDETPESYVLVNWLKGHCKKSDGTYWKVKMYGKKVDFNFSDFQVDSIDEDPIYWSSEGSRWNFDKVGNNGFSATDDPGPALSTEKGADYDLDFKIKLYKLSDIPKKTSGDLGGADSKAIDSKDWSYKVKVSDEGKFSH